MAPKPGLKVVAKVDVAKGTSGKASAKAGAATAVAAVAKGGSPKAGGNPVKTPATSAALAAFGSQLDLLNAQVQVLVAGNATGLLNEALPATGGVAVTKADREAVLIYVTTQVMNTVWQAASSAAQAMVPARPGKVITMRATPLHQPHQSCLRFFVCESDIPASDGIGTDARCC